MSDLIRQGSQWLEQMRASHMSSPVTYRRDEDSHEVNATFGRTEYEVEDEYGLRVGAQVTDFVISAEVFPFDEPEAGDQIVVPSTGSGQATVYEVMNLAGQGHWRWSDPYRQTMRIHTKEVDSE